VLSLTVLMTVLTVLMTVLMQAAMVVAVLMCVDTFINACYRCDDCDDRAGCVDDCADRC
jgi:hypothetical protein